MSEMQQSEIERALRMILKDDIEKRRACVMHTIVSIERASRTARRKKVTLLIEVTKLNGTKVLINAELIESVEETPDTVISFVTGKKIIVKESRQEIKNLVILYKRDFMASGLSWLRPDEEKG